jgi:hypothetical protein
VAIAGDRVEVRLDGPVPLDSPALTRLVTYALSAALRRRRRFELHSGALIDPAGDGLLIVGPSGSGKSTLSVHLAAAGWPFLTDDVLLLGREPAGVTAWPLRRCFAITPQTLDASPYLQTRARALEERDSEKQPFMPHDVFTSGFRDRCLPATLIFPELTGAATSAAAPLSKSDTMARLLRISPWAAYDRSTASAHLAVLSALAAQATGWTLAAGRDLLEPDVAVRTIAACTARGRGASMRADR